MRCKTCQYALWDLTSRTCPECGTAFAPSEFEFVPNAVRFCCPHCAQPYYGTDHRGHLVPQSFHCTSCQRPVSMDQMRLLPAEGVDELATEATTIPWIEIPQQKNPKLLNAFFRTIWMAMVSPTRLGEQLRPGSSCLRATAFALACTAIYVLVGVGAMIAFTLVMAVVTGGGGGVGVMLGASLAAVVIGVVVTILYNALWALCTHGLLALTGPRRAGLGTTYNAICYSTGANVVTAVPCVGGYFGWIWWLVSAVLITMKAQAVSGWRASLAVLAPPLLLIAGLVGLYIWFFYSILFAPGGTFATLGPGALNTTPQAAQTQLIGQIAQGNAPRHPAQLVADGLVSAEAFIHPDTPTLTSSVPVGTSTLGTMTPADAQAAADALPPDTIAVRLGDLVFTHYGIDIADPAHTALWLIVEWPDPDAGGLMPPNLVAYTAGGGSVSITLGSQAALDDALAAQNTVRAKAGLAPLPPPGDVTHDAPARSGP